MKSIQPIVLLNSILILFILLFLSSLLRSSLLISDCINLLILFFHLLLYWPLGLLEFEDSLGYKCQFVLCYLNHPVERVFFVLIQFVNIKLFLQFKRSNQFMMAFDDHKNYHWINFKTYFYLEGYNVYILDNSCGF